MKYAYTTLALAALALAVTHQVEVGPGLSYSPETLTAAEGDIVQFTFGSGHDVVSGSFDSPCQPDGLISSGDPDDGQVFSVTIGSTDPMWIYCSIPRHCQGGMAMVINPPSDGNTLDSYKSAASSVSSSSNPGSVVGGTFDNTSSGESSSETATGTASSPSATESSTSDSTASAGESAASAAATSEGAGGYGNAAGSVVAPLSMVLGAIAGGAALLL